jgi:hypothetical protein
MALSLCASPRIPGSSPCPLCTKISCSRWTIPLQIRNLCYQPSSLHTAQLYKNPPSSIITLQCPGCYTDWLSPPSPAAFYSTVLSLPTFGAFFPLTPWQLQTACTHGQALKTFTPPTRLDGCDYGETKGLQTKPVLCGKPCLKQTPHKGGDSPPSDHQTQSSNVLFASAQPWRTTHTCCGIALLLNDYGVWVFAIFSLKSNSPWIPDFSHVVLGTVLPIRFKQLQHWWELARGITMWHIWLHRNSVIFENPEARHTQSTIACHIWAQLHVYIRLDYKRLQRKLKTSSAGRAVLLNNEFATRWSPPPLGPTTQGKTLILPPVPFIALVQ